MASPDFSPYVDLTIYDKAPGDIYYDAITYAQNVALPEFNPRAGSIEDALLQAFSYASAEMIGTLNRVPNGLMEGILSLYGFARVQSISARLTIQVTMYTDDGTTIPAGALFSYDLDGETFFFATVADLVIAAGDYTDSVEAECLTVGTIGTIANGTDLTPISGVAGVVSAQSVGTMVQGQDEESDISYFTRGAIYLASRSNSVATATQMQNFLGSYSTEIARAYVSDLTKFKYLRASSITRNGNTATAIVNVGAGGFTNITDDVTFLPAEVTVSTSRVIVRYVDEETALTPINGTAIAGNPFTITACSYNSGTGNLTLSWYSASADSNETYLPASDAPFHSLTADEIGADPYIEILVHPDDYNDITGAVGLVFGTSAAMPLTNSAYLAVQAETQGRSVAGLTFTSIAPIRIGLDVSVTVSHLSTYGAIATRQAVATALQNYVSASSWQFAKSIYTTSLIGIAAGVTGVETVGELTFTATGEMSALATLTDGVMSFAYPFVIPYIETISVTGIV